MALSRSGRAATTGTGTDADIRIIDRRKFAELSDKAKPHTRQRNAADVYALVLHQMGFSRGNDPDRYDGVTAHYIILSDGGLYQLHDHSVRLPAANGFNSRSLSVEFAGNFPSRPRSTNPKHFWSPDTHGMDQLTPAQVASGRWMIDRFVCEGWLTHVLAHRQSGKHRQNDPGPDVWREVGAWAVRQYGLEWGGDGFSIGDGQAIPPKWWGSTGGVA